MMYYVQETDSKIIYPPPREFRYSLTDRLTNETLGGHPYTNYLPLPIEAGWFRAAWELAHMLRNVDVARETKKLLSVLQETLFTFKQFRFDVGHIPQLQAFAADDGSVLLEWIFRDYRVGFSIEPKPQDSGWFLITNKNLGEITASGFLSGIDLNRLILWLLNFILSNS